MSFIIIVFGVHYQAISFVYNGVGVGGGGQGQWPNAPGGGGGGVTGAPPGVV